MKPMNFFGLLVAGLFFWFSLAAVWMLVIDHDPGSPSPVRDDWTETLADGSESDPAVPPELSVAVESLPGEEHLSDAASTGGDSPFRSSPGSSFSPKNETVKAFMAQHRNSPLRFVPAAARQEDLDYLELHAQEVLTDWEADNARLASWWGNDLLGFSSDPKVKENDKNRQFRLRQLVESLWPGSLPGRKEKP